MVWPICNMEKGTRFHILLAWYFSQRQLNRYVNMDYAFASALRHSDANMLKVLYDIACQWHKKLHQRMDNMPPSLQLNLRDRNVSFLVPKFHLPAHIAPCQWSFSFNWTKGVGRMDGEEPERGWASLNAAASSTKDMGPGHRRDTLDDYMGDWNWKKLVRLGVFLLILGPWRTHPLYRCFDLSKGKGSHPRT